MNDSEAVLGSGPNIIVGHSFVWCLAQGVGVELLGSPKTLLKNNKLFAANLKIDFIVIIYLHTFNMYILLQCIF